MSFFNKKEDVIDIQLTPHGKHLLSLGKFKPSYYAFFDDDVLYDAQYAAGTTGGNKKEEQNDIQDRIEETPHLKTQHVYSSREKSVRKLTTLLTNYNDADDPTEDEKTQDTIAKHYANGMPLGTSSLGDNKIPAWDVTLLNGDLASSKSYMSIGTGATGAKRNIKIPQLNVEPINYTTEVKEDYNNYTNEQIKSTLEGSLTMYDKKYIDDTYLVVDEDFLLVGISEINADFDKDNFEIEVFRVEAGDNGEELTPLSFKKDPVKIKDGILLDEPEGGVDKTSPFDPALENTSYVEYWFDILCDHEIPDSILCENLSKADARGNIYIQDSLNCPDKTKIVSTSQTGVATEEEEEC